MVHILSCALAIALGVQGAGGVEDELFFLWGGGGGGGGGGRGVFKVGGHPPCILASWPLGTISAHLLACQR